MGPALVLLLVTQSDGRPIPTAVVRQAIVEVLGAVRVLAKEVSQPLPDEEAARRGHAMHAAIVYQVSWTQLDPPVIEVRAWTSDGETDERWLVRRLDFTHADSLTEIARSVGFAAAAMAPQYGPARERQASTRWRPGGDATEPGLAVEHAPAPAAHARAVLVDLLGSAGLTDGRSPAWGGGLRLGWAATRLFHPSAALTGSTEVIEAAQSRASRLDLCVGGALTLVASTRASLALRVEAEVVLQMATRFSDAQGQTMRQSRWLPAVMSAVEGNVALSSGVGLVLAGGYEVAAGRTDLYVGSVKSASIPAARAVAEGGVRVRF